MSYKIGQSVRYFEKSPVRSALSLRLRTAKIIKLGKRVIIVQYQDEKGDIITRKTNYDFIEPHKVQ